MVDSVLEQIESAEEFCTFHKTSEARYLKKPHVSVALTNTNKQYLCITNMENVQIRGKTCASYCIESEDIHLILNKFNYSFSKLLEALNKRKDEFKNRHGGNDFYDCKVYFGEDKSVRFYSPLSHDRFKPLKSEPKKWTISHVIRGLINNQITNTRCESSYTDDYAHDAASNYGAGKADPIALAKDLVERPSGWWVNRKAGNYIGINCHSFKYMAGDLKI